MGRCPPSGRSSGPSTTNRGGARRGRCSGPAAPAAERLITGCAGRTGGCAARAVKARRGLPLPAASEQGASRFTDLGESVESARQSASRSAARPGSRFDREGFAPFDMLRADLNVDFLTTHRSSDDVAEPRKVVNRNTVGHGRAAVAIAGCGGRRHSWSRRRRGCGRGSRKRLRERA